MESVRLRRWMGVATSIRPDSHHPHRCQAPGCGWRGSAGVDRTGADTGVAATPQPRSHLRWVRSVAALLGGTGLAVGASLLVLQLGTLPADQLVHPGGAHRLAPGEHFDGEPLQSVAAARPAGTALPATDLPLGLRQDCVWGKPGRNPYQGTVEQALVAARLPAELVAPIAARIRARQPSDRVSISTAMIRSDRGGREFSPRGLGLSFGHTMCLNSRVNFAPGHVEKADLYEMVDATGRQRAVMVPDVCGNVSVLSAGAERGPLRRLLARPLALVQSALGVGGAADGPALAFAVGDAGTANNVPEPGTLGCVLAALAALWAAIRLRRRR